MSLRHEQMETDELMPVLFVGHGSPVNGIEDNAFAREWQEVAKRLPRPKAILCVSAHWEFAGIQVTAMAGNPTSRSNGSTTFRSPVR